MSWAARWCDPRCQVSSIVVVCGSGLDPLDPCLGVFIEAQCGCKWRGELSLAISMFHECLVPRQGGHIRGGGSQTQPLDLQQVCSCICSCVRVHTQSVAFMGCGGIVGEAVDDDRCKYSDPLRLELCTRYSKEEEGWKACLIGAFYLTDSRVLLNSTPYSLTVLLQVKNSSSSDSASSCIS
ncbi:hypothetical protein EGR_07588 [Echinococcus granulosus]|uniref:Uncharacterized protein n=1 Tax=Echinococcus granulosus TaxID=6210 RepID=W6UHL1_ECHGR|nr:hypothetical protein EGR_07588 [Echinococcus granulosus]EUB57577.1 hypothetical protein EGR_07588 [Echinococcus granulosus]